VRRAVLGGKSGKVRVMKMKKDPGGGGKGGNKLKREILPMDRGQSPERSEKKCLKATGESAKGYSIQGVGLQRCGTKVGGLRGANKKGEVRH